jgi:hypothetical protein
MGTVRELRSRSGSPDRPLIRLIVNDDGESAKILHLHRARGARAAERISHPSMFAEHRFPWDPDRGSRRLR